jgi:hypothetical protein
MLLWHFGVVQLMKHPGSCFLPLSFFVSQIAVLMANIPKIDSLQLLSFLAVVVLLFIPSDGKIPPSHRIKVPYHMQVTDYCCGDVIFCFLLSDTKWQG